MSWAIREWSRPGPGLRDASVDIGYLEGDVDDPVTVDVLVRDDGTCRVHATLDHESDRTALQHERVVIAIARGGSRVSDEFHSEGGLKEFRGLSGIADRPDQRVPAGHRERVGRVVVLDQTDQLPELIDIEASQFFLVGQCPLDTHDVTPLVVCGLHKKDT